MNIPDLDALLSPQEWAWNRCTVAQAINLIEDEGDRAKVAAACDNTLVPANNIAQAFHALIGKAPAGGTIRRHQTRRTNANSCRCP